VLIRLALTAPPFVNAALGLGAVVFALGLSLAYERFAPAEPRRLAAALGAGETFRNPHTGG
jgi:hypothetical protein